MHLTKTPPELASCTLAALTAVGRAAESGLEQPQRALLDAIQRLVTETQIDLDSLPPTAPRSRASRMVDPEQNRQLVRLMLLLSVADGPPSRAQIELIKSHADAMEVDEPAVGIFGLLAAGRMLRFKLAFARRSHVRIYMRNTRRLVGGIIPTLEAVLRFRGVLREDTEVAGRFRALESLPEETLGHRFFRHCREEGLPFSGEKGGFPPGALYHDFTHLLSGYDTTPEGEMKAASFQAGFTADGFDFFTMLFGILIHTAGINLTPFEMPVLRGRIGRGQLALEVLHALQRGSAVKVDLGREWDFWDDLDRPIDEVRAELGISPVDRSLFEEVAVGSAGPHEVSTPTSTSMA